MGFEELKANLHIGPRQKVMITLPEGTLEKLDRYTKQLHYSRSGAINEAILLWLTVEDQIMEE